MLKLLSKLLCKLEDIELPALVIGTIIIAVIMLRLSVWLYPPPDESNPKFKNWSSKPVTGWSNLNPKKMATYRQVEVQSGVVKPNPKEKFEGV